MDPISLSILKIVAKEEIISSGGVTPYKIMRELNLYPPLLINWYSGWKLLVF
jgi:hypothetical protein